MICKVEFYNLRKKDLKKPIWIWINPNRLFYFKTKSSELANLYKKYGITNKEILDDIKNAPALYYIELEIALFLYKKYRSNLDFLLENLMHAKKRIFPFALFSKDIAYNSDVLYIAYLIISELQKKVK
jgi:hypothetical protein